MLETADVALVNAGKLSHLLLTQLSRLAELHQLACHRVVGAKSVQYVLAAWSEARLDLRNVCVEVAPCVASATDSLGLHFFLWGLLCTTCIICQTSAPGFHPVLLLAEAGPQARFGLFRHSPRILNFSPLAGAARVSALVVSGEQQDDASAVRGKEDA